MMKERNDFSIIPCQLSVSALLQAWELMVRL